MKKLKWWMLCLLLCILVAGITFAILIKKDNEEVNTQAVMTESEQDGEKLLSSTDGKADILSGVNAKEPVIALTLDGMTDSQKMQDILEILKEYKIQACFCVEGTLAAEDEEIVRAISNSGYEVASYSLKGDKHLERKSVEELYHEFYKTNDIIKTITGKMPGMLKGNVTTYTYELRHAAWTAGNTHVVKSDIMLSSKSFKNYEETKGYVSRMKKGAIVSFKLGEELDAKEYSVHWDEKPAEDLQEGIQTEKQEKEQTDIVETIRMFAQALNECEVKTVELKELSDYETVKEAFSAGNEIVDEVNNYVITAAANALAEKKANQNKTDQKTTNQNTTDQNTTDAETEYVEKLQKKNQGKKAEELQDIRIVSDYVVFSFYGIENKKELDRVLRQLKKMDAKAIFFVDELQMKLYADRIREIKEEGNEVGVAILPQNASDYTDAAKTIYQSRKMLNQIIAEDTDFVMQPWGDISDGTKEAVSALEMTLVGHDCSVVKGKHKKETDADKIVRDVFGRYGKCLYQGEIVYYRMNYYKDSTLLARVVEVVKEQKVDNAGYQVVGVRQLLQDGQYVYPIDSSQISSRVNNQIYAGQLKGEDPMSAISKAYIGNPSAQSVLDLPGFTESELEQLDMTGTIKDTDREIFLTFDDWGSDAEINKLLKVLEKHNVKATFFIKTEYAKDNPNLLRRIALYGHTLASHTDTHFTLANRDEKNNCYYELSGGQIKTLRSELEKSYRVLCDAAGDIEINGYPAVRTWLRPPTLAVSKNALEIAVDEGYSYIICGDVSTHDYEADSAEELYQNIKDSIQPGSILVMHMSEEAAYTADALERLLTENERKSEKDTSRFKVGNLNDYLAGEGYEAK